MRGDVFIKKAMEFGESFALWYRENGELDFENESRFQS